MRVVFNDVILALEARNRAVIRHFAMLAVIVIVCTPSSCSTPDDVTDKADGSADKKITIVHTSLIYICDISSNRYCHFATVQSWALNNVHGIYEHDTPPTQLSPPCREDDLSCFLKNSTTDSHVVQVKLADKLSLHIHISFHNVSGGVYKLMQDLDNLMAVYSSHVLLCIGSDVTVQTAAIVADSYGIPIIGYVTQDENLSAEVQGGMFTSLNPSAEAQGMVLAQIIGHYNMKQTSVIIQDTKVADGFLQGMRKVASDRQRDVFHVLCLSNTISSDHLFDKLVDLSTTGWKLMVVHTDPSLMLRVVNSAVSTRLYNTGHAWFLSEGAYSRDQHTLSQLPEGLLGIKSFWLGGISDVMVTALDHVVRAFAVLFRHVDTATFDNVPYNYDTSGSATDLNTSIENGSLQDAVVIANWTWENENRKLFIRNIRESILCSRFTPENTDPHCSADFLHPVNNTDNSNHNQTNTTFNEEINDHFNSMYIRKRRKRNVSLKSLDKNITRGPAYNLLNTVSNGTRGMMWSSVGYITIKGHQNLRTVLWPGHNIYGPAVNGVKTYRVVTRAAEPFVFITRKVNKKEECIVDLVCLQVTNSSKHVLTKAVDDFQTDGLYINKLYTIHCCDGLALDMIKTLSYDLNFKFVVYFVNDTNYGTYENGVWTGMVGDLASGSADIIAGAFSITSQRMDAIYYTEPFYNNEYAQAAGQDGNDVSMWAFKSPFSGQVWMCIFMSSIVAGLATSFLEWHSPFGLNPKGRKRTKNYGLGSGLLMVMVLVTGHTINIKAPKSWPGKVIQNVWAGLAIFMMASYTANLAAYLAGQSAVTPATSIFDPELLRKKTAIVESSAVESFLNKINPTLGKRSKENYVKSTVEAINLLREGKIDVYFDDIALLEHGLALYDKDCKVNIAGKGFGTDGYAFGLAKHSWWLQIPMSNMISEYTYSGHVKDLANRYMSRPQCENYVVGTATAYGLEHTGGLFLILLSSIFCSIALLFCEHLIYHFAVPWMRRKPAHSFWKTETLAFISQRLSRVVRSERLYSQKQAAQEMIKIVKQRDFTRLIQKNELQKRKNPVQKKVKSKAEVFQEITANIISNTTKCSVGTGSKSKHSYHRQLQSASEDAETVASSENADFLNGLSPDAIAIDMNGSPDLVGVNNTGFRADSVEMANDCYFARQISDYEDGSRETAFMFDNVRDYFAESEDFPDLDLPRRMSSRSWAFPPRQLPETFGLQRHSTSHCRHIKKKNPSDTNHESRFVEDSRTNSPSKQSVSCDNQQPSHQQDVQLFHSMDSDNHLDVSLSPPAHSSSSLCLSSLSANSSFFPSPPSSQLQSPLEDEDRTVSQTTPSCHTTETNVSGQIRYASHEPNAQQRPCQSPRIPEIPLDPVVLDTTHKAPSPSQKDSLANNSYMSDDHCERFPVYEDGISSRQNYPSASHRLYNDHGTDDSVFDETSTDIPFSAYNRKKGSFPLQSKELSELNKNMRKYSDLSDYRPPPSNLAVVNIGQRRKSYDKQSRDYFKRNIKLKDNRVKSTLRHHAMSGYQSTLPADFIDECTLEALSKEDLLVLWKKSEIDLESRLNEVLDRNRRLGLAIEYLSQAEKQEGPTLV